MFYNLKEKIQNQSIGKNFKPPLVSLATQVDTGYKLATQVDTGYNYSNNYLISGIRHAIYVNVAIIFNNNLARLLTLETCKRITWLSPTEDLSFEPGKGFRAPNSSRSGPCPDRRRRIPPDHLDWPNRDWQGSPGSITDKKSSSSLR